MQPGTGNPMKNAVDRIFEKHIREEIGIVDVPALRADLKKRRTYPMGSSSYVDFLIEVRRSPGFSRWHDCALAGLRGAIQIGDTDSARVFKFVWAESARERDWDASARTIAAFRHNTASRNWMKKQIEKWDNDEESRTWADLARSALSEVASLAAAKKSYAKESVAPSTTAEETRKRGILEDLTPSALRSLLEKYGLGFSIRDAKSMLVEAAMPIPLSTHGLMALQSGAVHRPAKSVQTNTRKKAAKKTSKKRAKKKA